MSDHPLELCFKILQSLGEAGEIVWELGKLYVERKRDPLTQEERLAYLTMAIRHIRDKMKENQEFKERTGSPMWRSIPLDFRTFVESPRLLNKMAVLWPGVMAEGEEINSGKYSECVLTGAIGVAKTTLALYTQSCQTYILSCMYNPHEVFDLDPSSEILIVFQSVDKNAANDVDYRRIRDMIAGSPYFNEKFPFQKDRESDMRFPRNIQIKPVAGHDTAAIGRNVIGGLIDEVNYQAVTANSKMSNDGGLYDQAMENYNAIATRRRSRFMQLGRLPGMLCLVSSRNYPGQFTDKKEEEAKTNPLIYVYDKRIWELRPERYSKERFMVFTGDETRKPRILADGETWSDEDATLVREVPLDFRQFFESNILKELRDTLGVSTQAINPFFTNTDSVSASFGRVQSIASRESCDFLETRLEIYPKRIFRPELPRFIHVDPGITRDNAGFAMACCPGFKECDRGDFKEKLPIIRFDMLLAIKPPKNGEIEFAKMRSLVYALRSLGVNIKWFTMDTSNSRDSLQIMAHKGFVVGEQSVDETVFPYELLKQAMYDERVEAPAHPLAQRELVRLNFIAKDQKVDHPPHGSKDVGDAMAGVVAGLTMRREIWTANRVSLRDVPKAITKAAETANKNSLTAKETLQQQRGMKNWLDRKREEKANGGKSVILVRDDPSALRRDN